MLIISDHLWLNSLGVNSSKFPIVVWCTVYSRITVLSIMVYKTWWWHHTLYSMKESSFSCWLAFFWYTVSCWLVSHLLYFVTKKLTFMLKIRRYWGDLYYQIMSFISWYVHIKTRTLHINHTVWYLSTKHSETCNVRPSNWAKTLVLNNWWSLIKDADILKW